GLVVRDARRKVGDKTAWNVIDHQGDRLFVRKSEPLDPDDLFGLAELEHLGDPSGRFDLARLYFRRPRRKPKGRQSLGPTRDGVENVGELGLLHKGAPALLPDDEPLGDELLDGPADGDAA